MEILNVALLSVVVLLKREFWTTKFGRAKMCHNIEGVVWTSMINEVRLYKQTNNHPISRNLLHHCHVIWRKRSNLDRSWIGGRYSTPYKLMRAGATPTSNFLNPTENCCPPQPTSKENIALAILKATWLQFPHIECTSPPRFKIQYICALPISRYEDVQ